MVTPAKRTRAAVEKEAQAEPVGMQSEKVPTPKILKLNRRGTLTLPKSFRATWGDQEVVFEAILRADGVIELRPRVMTDAGQVWFWTARWQQMEREANADFAEGRFARFDDVESFLQDLDTE